MPENEIAEIAQYAVYCVGSFSSHCHDQ